MAAESAKVIVIDDDADFAEFVRTVLAGEGHDVFVATDGATGVAAARQQRPSLAIVDLLMTPRDGFSICEELRLHPETRDAGILIVTGIRKKLHKTFASADVGPKLDVDGFLEKPFGPEELVRSVDEVLRLTRSRGRGAWENP